MTAIFWDMTQCGYRKKSRRFGGTYHLYLQVNQTLSLPTSQRGFASRRRAKGASCNGTSTAGFIHCRGVVVDGRSFVEWVLISLPTEENYVGSKPLFSEICSSETSVLLTRAKRRHIPEDNVRSSNILVELWTHNPPNWQRYCYSLIRGFPWLLLFTHPWFSVDSHEQKH
jgi:hypothetical protein